MANWIPPMNSPARKETDSLLEDLEKRIKQEYEQAAKEVQKKADSYFKQFAKQDAEKQAAVKSGELTQEAYKKWRVEEVMKGSRYTAMIDDLSSTAVNADKAAMNIINGSLPETFRINANYGAYEVERATGIDTSFTLYNKDAVADLIKNQPDLLPKPSMDIPKDRRWNRQHMNSAITQGILQGEDIRKISKRLQSVTDMDSRAAIRNARTMTTSAENAGAMHSYKRAEEMGIKGQKMWMATHDSRTRDSHVMLDGEMQNLHDEFSNGLQQPGDPSGDPSEVYNCRCRIVYASNRSQLKQNYDELNKKVVIDGKSYDEWKQESYTKWTAKHEQKQMFDDTVSEKAQAIIDAAKGFGGIDYLEVGRLDIPLSEDEIIEKLAGGDNTKGSCMSLSLSYAGNKCGYDVTDYRGGASQRFFSMVRTTSDIARLDGVEAAIISSYNDIEAANILLEKVKAGKDYILITGRHAAIIRQAREGLQYLEMQSARANGWKLLDDFVLRNRFACKKSHSIYGTKVKMSNFLIDVESMSNAQGFRQILGYLNTSAGAQMKGLTGYER